MASNEEPETDLNNLSKDELIELIKKNNKDNIIQSRIQNVKSDVTHKQTAKQNSPGLGIEYEVYLPAYFALLLNINPEIKDFTLQSNAQGFGNLDDLLVDIKTKSGENFYFAFQLKHTEKSDKNLLPTNFEAKSNYQLEKYCESYKKLNKANRKKYHFILYTNKNFDSSRANQVKKFDMKQDECWLMRDFFDTSGGGKHLYKFEVNEDTEDGKNVNQDDFREFFSQFSLYTGQATIKDLEKSILDILKHKECYATYIDFFRRWHRGDFIDKLLDMKTLNAHLLDIFLSSVTINYHLSDGQDENSIFFETIMVQQFDVTIIDASKQDFIKLLEETVVRYPEEFNKSSEELIQLGRNYKFMDKFAKELKEGAKVKLLHHFYPKFISQLKENIQEYPESFNRSLEECNKNSEEYRTLVKDKKFIEELKKGTDLKLLQNIYKKFMKQLKENFQEHLREFDKSSEEYMIQFVKDDSKFIEELKEEVKLKLLYYFYQKPLILDFNESSKDLIYEAIKLCKIQESGMKLVILGRNIDLSKFSHLRAFTSLKQIDRNVTEEIKRRCNLSLQGRNISFEEIFEDEIRGFVTPKEIFQMLKGSFSIGGKKENLPECYISRTVSATVFDIKSVIKNSSSSAAIIFYCKDEFEKLKTTVQTIVSHQGISYEEFLDTKTIILKMGKSFKDQLLIPTIILTKEKCSKQQFETIQEKVLEFKNELINKLIAMISSKTENVSKAQSDKIRQQLLGTKKESEAEEDGDGETRKNEVHLFNVLNENKCLLLMTTKSISIKDNYKSTKISVEENDIHVFFNNSVNILCAQPGMGKSALMRCLKNTCDPSFWTVRLDLKAHNHFFTRNHKIEDVLNYFLELEKCQNLFPSKMKELFLRKKKMVFFLDGLDEVSSECVDCVLNITRQLSEMGFRIWLASRQNLQQKIENYFNIFAIEIDEINENQQKGYIEERLESLYNENEIEEIVKKIFNNIDLANNRQILEIPLQLRIITDAFAADKSHYSNLNESNFTLTKMFEIFFKGKYNHYLAKMELKHAHQLEEQLEKYEIVALQSVLDDEHFQKLQIEKLKPIQIKNLDILSIIKEINNQNKADFEHLTYAEYFASKFLVKNFDQVRILSEEIFSKKYQNLFFIFNTMLAEDSPLHLAVIYKNLKQIQETEGPSLVDKGGRNILQVAACFATRHASLEYNVYKGLIFNKTKFVLVKDYCVKHFKGEDSKIKKIVDSAVLSSEPFKTDKIFKWDSLDYALAAGALYVVEAILVKFGRPPKFYQKLEKYYCDELIAYYSIRFGYHRLLSEILVKKTCDVWSIHSDYLQEVNQRNQLISRLTAKNILISLAGSFGVFAVLTILFPYLAPFALLPYYTLSVALTKTTKSILRFSMLPVCANRIKIIELLIGDGVNKTVYNDCRCSLLHLAVIHENIEVVKFLLERGADVNVKTKYGMSPLSLASSYKIDEDETQLLWKIEENVISNNNQNITELFQLLSSTINSCYGWNVGLMKLLLNKGADFKETDKMLGEPLIQLAAKRGNFELVSILIGRGASWNEETFLHAIYGGNTQIIDLFLDKGVDLSKLTALYKKKYIIRS